MEHVVFRNKFPRLNHQAIMLGSFSPGLLVYIQEKSDRFFVY